MALASFSCAGCRRTFQAPPEQVAARRARGQVRCQVCGGALVFPEAPPAPALDPGGAPAFDPAEQLSYACQGCKRSFRAELGTLVRLLHTERTACQLCGAALALPGRVAEALTALQAAGVAPVRRDLACPVCDRPVKAEGDEAELDCRTCGARFLRPPAGETAGRPRPREGTPAALADVMAVEARFALGLAGSILRARAAKGELTREDLAEAMDAWVRLSGWTPREDEPPTLPLAPAVALDLAPHLLFPGRPFVLERGPQTTCVYVVETSGGRKLASGLAGLLTFNAIGAISLGVLGVGLFRTRAHDDGDPGPRTQRRLRLVLEPDPAGGTALRLMTQQDADPPLPAPAAAQAELCRELVTRRPIALAWAGALALHGAWIRGPLAFALTPAATRRRLEALGGDLAARAAELAPALCPGHVPTGPLSSR